MERRRADGDDRGAAVAARAHLDAVDVRDRLAQGGSPGLAWRTAALRAVVLAGAQSPIRPRARPGTWRRAGRPRGPCRPASRSARRRARSVVRAADRPGPPARRRPSRLPGTDRGRPGPRRWIAARARTHAARIAPDAMALRDERGTGRPAPGRCRARSPQGGRGTGLRRQAVPGAGIEGVPMAAGPAPSCRRGFRRLPPRHVRAPPRRGTRRRCPPTARRAPRIRAKAPLLRPRPSIVRRPAGARPVRARRGPAR